MSAQAKGLKDIGDNLLRGGMYEEAKMCYLEALQVAIAEDDAPLLPVICRNLAQVRYKLGKLRECNRYARLSIQEKPDWEKGYYRAALAAEGQGKVSEALVLLERGINLCASNEDLKALKTRLEEVQSQGQNADMSAKQPPPPLKPWQPPPPPAKPSQPPPPAKPSQPPPPAKPSQPPPPAKPSKPPPPAKLPQPPPPAKPSKLPPPAKLPQPPPPAKPPQPPPPAKPSKLPPPAKPSKLPPPAKPSQPSPPAKPSQPSPPAKPSKPPPPAKLPQPPPPAKPPQPATPRSKSHGRKAGRGVSSKRAASVAADRKGVWGNVLAGHVPVEEDRTAAAEPIQHQSLEQELCATVRRGSRALQRDGGAREAQEEYRRGLLLLARHSAELQPSVDELCSLRYCYAMACHDVATSEALLAAEKELLVLIREMEKPKPAARYMLGKIYLRLNRFEQASKALRTCLDVLDRGVRGETHVFPGTSEVIPDTELAWHGTLRGPALELLQQCRYAPRPDAVCRLPDCGVTVTEDGHQRTRRGIYYSDVDFTGFMKIECLDKCRLEYHVACWRLLKDRFGSETQRTADKDLLNTPCPTPDCSSKICLIVTVGASGEQKHEISSDEYRRLQQRPQAKQQTKQQKRQATQAQKKHQVVKGQKRKDSVPYLTEDEDSQKSASEPPAGAAAATAAAATAAAAAPEPAPAAGGTQPAPDLRQMTVLQRGSDLTEVQATKKAKRKKKGPSHLRRRPADQFWATFEDSAPYNGPPIGVIYRTDDADLAARRHELEELRTLRFSVRSLIPDTSVQPATVPRDEQATEEEHTVLESAYQFMYDHLKKSGPVLPSDPRLLAAVSQLPATCQELIVQLGSLEDFLLRLPRFCQLDDLLCVEADVPMAETMLASAVSEVLDDDGAPEAGPETPAPGLGRAEPAPTDPEPEPTEPGRTGEEPPEPDTDGEDSAEAGSTREEPAESAQPEASSPAPAGLSSPADEESDGFVTCSDQDAPTNSGSGAQGDGAWNTDPELIDDSAAAQSEALAGAKANQPQLKQTVRQLTRESQRPPAGRGDPGRSELQQQLTETQRSLVAMRAQRDGREERLADVARQLDVEKLRHAETKQQLEDTRQHVAVQEQRLEELTNELAVASSRPPPTAAIQKQLEAESARASRLEQQLEAESARASRLEQQLLEARTPADEQRRRREAASYVSMLSSAGKALTDGATRRCEDAVAGAQSLAAARGAPYAALPAVNRLQQAIDQIKQTHSQFKESITQAIKAINKKEDVNLQSLKLPEIPDIDGILASYSNGAMSGAAAAPAAAAVPAAAPAAAAPTSAAASRTAAAAAPARAAVAAPAAAAAAAAPRPSSALTVSSSGSSDCGQTIASPPPAGAVLRRPRPRRALTPAAQQLSEAAAAAQGNTTFNTLVDEIMQRCGGAAGREAVLNQLAAFRGQRGGSLRGIDHAQIVEEVAARILAADGRLQLVAAAGGGEAAPDVASFRFREECIMCTESYSAEQSVQLECGHRFHERCLLKWGRETNGSVTTCPNCRHPSTSYIDFPQLP